MPHVGPTVGAGRRKRRTSSNPPVNAALPTVAGSPVSGQTLTATTGTWSGATPITYAYQWRRDSADISGATAATYGLGVADIGATITVRVTATNSAGSAFAVSAGLGPVAAPYVPALAFSDARNSQFAPLMF